MNPTVEALTVPCSYCKGKGECAGIDFYEYTCLVCEGTGRVSAPPTERKE